jgi:hypothetical protein
VVIGKSSLLTKLQPHHLDQEAIRSRPSPSPYRLESHSALVFERVKSKTPRTGSPSASASPRPARGVCSRTRSLPNSIGALSRCGTRGEWKVGAVKAEPLSRSIILYESGRGLEMALSRRSVFIKPRV